MDLSAIRNAIKAVADKIITVQMGTVISTGDEMAVSLDGPSTTPVAATSIAGPLPEGTRVACLAYPPRGLLILGPAGATGSLADVSDTDWIAVVGGVGFQNSWVNYGSGWAAAAYRKVGNEVHIKGLVTGGTIGSTIFTLPVGFRPAENRLLTASTNLKTVANGVQAAVGNTGGNSVNGDPHTHGLGAHVHGFSTTLAEPCRLDVHSTGAVIQQSGTHNGWQSIECSFLI